MTHSGVARTLLGLDLDNATVAYSEWTDTGTQQPVSDANTPLPVRQEEVMNELLKDYANQVHGWSWCLSSPAIRADGSMC